jgi:hypothetical protein
LDCAYIIDRNIEGKRVAAVSAAAQAAQTRRGRNASSAETGRYSNTDMKPPPPPSILPPTPVSPKRDSESKLSKHTFTI